MWGQLDMKEPKRITLMLYGLCAAIWTLRVIFGVICKDSNQALEVLRWAVEKGFLNGKGGGILDPGGEATRAETAQMLKNFMEKQ